LTRRYSKLTVPDKGGVRGSESFSAPNRGWGGVGGVGVFSDGIEEAQESRKLEIVKRGRRGKRHLAVSDQHKLIHKPKPERRKIRRGRKSQKSRGERGNPQVFSPLPEYELFTPNTIKRTLVPQFKSPSFAIRGEAAC